MLLPYRIIAQADRNEFLHTYAPIPVQFLLVRKNGRFLWSYSNCGEQKGRTGLRASSGNIGAKQAKQILWLICPRAVTVERSKRMVAWHQAHTILM
jgi:hypothetical protein